MHRELQTAIAAVVRASRLTQKIFISLQAGQSASAGTVTKLDKSPVTIADYGSQAIVNAVLRSAFPKDPIVGEENSEELRRNSVLREKVWRLVSSTLEETSPDDLASVGGRIETPDDMMNLIDKGDSEGGSVGRKILFLVCELNCIRILDAGSHRWDFGISTRRAVCRLSGFDCGWQGRGRGFRMSQFTNLVQQLGKRGFAVWNDGTQSVRNLPEQSFHGNRKSVSNEGHRRYLTSQVLRKCGIWPFVPRSAKPDCKSSRNSDCFSEDGQSG
jgi:hypothetical protein